MRIGEIIGGVTLSTCHPSLRGAIWRVAVPLELDGLRNDAGSAGRGEAFVIYDELGGGLGSRVAIAEGPEATAPFLPEQKPIDGYNAAILDEIDIEAKPVQ